MSAAQLLASHISDALAELNANDDGTGVSQWDRDGWYMLVLEVLEKHRFRVEQAPPGA